MLKDLEKQLKGGVAPIYVVIGDEGLTIKRAEDAISAAALSGGGAAFNRDIFRAGEENAGEALAVARTLPMLAERRLVVLRDAQEAPAALLEQVTDYIASPNPSTVFVVTGQKWPAPVGGKDWGRRAEGAAKKAGVVLRVKSKDQDPIGFCVEIARGLGCTLGRGEAELLVERVGADLGRLELELMKAAAWLGAPGAITAEALRETSSLLAEAEVWSLTDALVSGDSDHALETAHRLLEHGEPAHKLLAMVTWQFRQLLRLQDALSAGRDPRSAGVRMRYNKLREAERSLRSSPLDPVAVLETLAAANQAMNSHRAGHRRIFEGLILQLLAR